MRKTIVLFFTVVLALTCQLVAGVSTLPTNSSTIYEIRFTPSGSALFVADHNSIKVFSFPDTELLGEFSGGHHSQVMSIAVSKDSTLLASGDRDGRIVLWDINTRQEIVQLPLHDGIVLSMDISPDGRYLISGGTDHKVQLYDLQQKKVVKGFYQHTRDVTVVRFHPGGSAFFSGSGDKRIIHYSINNLKSPEIIGEHDDWVRHLAISPDGSMLTSVGDDRRVRNWNVSDPSFIRPRATLRIVPGWNTSVDYFADNTTLAVGSIRGRIVIQAKVTQFTYNVRRPVNQILLWPGDEINLIAVVATRGKGVKIIPGFDMKIRR